VRLMWRSPVSQIRTQESFFLDNNAHTSSTIFVWSAWPFRSTAKETRIASKAVARHPGHEGASQAILLVRSYSSALDVAEPQHQRHSSMFSQPTSHSYGCASTFGILVQGRLETRGSDNGIESLPTFVSRLAERAQGSPTPCNLVVRVELSGPGSNTLCRTVQWDTAINKH
jgi:hypothetical protein